MSRSNTSSQVLERATRIHPDISPATGRRRRGTSVFAARTKVLAGNVIALCQPVIQDFAMKIGFLNNRIDERGAWQTFLYAKYCHLLLGHSTAVLYPTVEYDAFFRPKKRPWYDRFLPKSAAPARASTKPHFDQKIADRMIRDGIPVVETAWDADFSAWDAIYHMKSGENDGFSPRGTRYWVHAVFNAAQPHGDRYIAASQWLSQRDGAPFVPAIVDLATDSQDLRKELGIPAEAVVFGRFGGRDTFDIPWVWDGLEEVVARLSNVYFLFANTDTKKHHKQIISLPTIYDGEVSLEVQKRRFINTCDYMLHARKRGETFGIAPAEFALCGKPVLTYGKSPEISHIEMLAHPICYRDQAELVGLVENCASGKTHVEDGGGYRNCTPEKVMAIFDEKFIR
jgi:glycosyltransferase involved in cell wall biosynthesis